LIDPAVEAGPVIWTARLRTGHVVIFQASAPRIFNAAASIAAAAVVDLVAAATDSVVAVGLAAGALGALVGSAAVVVDSGVGDNNYWLEQRPNVFVELRHTTHRNKAYEKDIKPN
jgi:hypothetical protein